MWRTVALCLVACSAQADVVVIGNSIALIPTWKGGAGMAASSPANDYAHLIGATRIYNFANFERGQPYALPDGPIDALVVQLGDNVDKDVPGFMARYRAMLRTLKPKRLVCVSTFWSDPARDAAIYDACTDARGEYVFIGDLFKDRRNTDRSEKVSDNADVNNHPHDWAMARIAERVTKALAHSK